MILLRLDNIEGKHCEIVGGEKLKKYKYSENKSGWFPIESMEFGFQASSESQQTPPGGNQQRQPGGGRAGGNAATPPASNRSNVKESDKDFSSINVGKMVDGVTADLMSFAMQDRKVTKADESKMRKADIHCLHSVMEKSDKPERFIFPYLLITLEDVLIKGWRISAQGDDRPSETFEIYFDKAAIRYYRTKDGMTWNSSNVCGWDQGANDVWTPPASANYFNQPPF